MCPLKHRFTCGVLSENLKNYVGVASGIFHDPSLPSFPLCSSPSLPPLCSSLSSQQIKTTAPNRYKVRPNINLVGGAESADIQVKLLTGSNDMISQDKFLVQAYKFPPGATPPDPVQLPNFWKSLARDKSVEEYRYHWLLKVIKAC